MRARIAVLASGGGTNLQAILDHFGALGDARSGDVVLVASNRACGALERAERAGVPTAEFDASGDGALLDLLDRHAVDIVALAGYLKLIPSKVVSAFPERIINVHPGPLPAFGGPGMYGTRVHGAVLAAGVTESAVTVHLVDERYDHGRVLAQWPVPVRTGDSVEQLAARVLAVEHIVFPRMLDALAATVVRGA
jgi:formyltetrahydrofolate-dependent phosphoribosylglycinamide formyltransferase